MPRALDKPALAGLCDGDLCLVDLEGRTIAHIPLPLTGREPSSVAPLPYKTGETPLLAMARTIKATWKRSELVVVGPAGPLYHEIFPAPGVAAAAGEPDAGRATLYVAAWERGVLRYRISPIDVAGVAQ